MPFRRVRFAATQTTLFGSPEQVADSYYIESAGPATLHTAWCAAGVTGKVTRDLECAGLGGQGWLVSVVGTSESLRTRATAREAIDEARRRLAVLTNGQE